MRIKKRILLFLIIFLFFSFNPLLLPHVMAEDCISSDVGCIPTDIGSFVETYYRWGLGLVGGLSLLFIIMGGYIIMTSRGNPQQLNNGKSYLFYALIGLFLAIFGFLFIEVIAKNLLHIPGFG
jgi:hypothetical protein